MIPMLLHFQGLIEFLAKSSVFIEISSAMKLLLLFSILGCAQAHLNEGSSCKTSRQESGVCRNVHNCSAILEILRSPPISPQDQNYMKDSVCRMQGKTPIVCCPSEIARPESTTSRPLNQPSNPLEGVSNHPNLRLLPQRTCGKSFLIKIQGGNVTDLGEYPWLAVIAYRMNDSPEVFLCGGVLINSKYILTAAHCTTNIAPYSLSTVRLGEHDLSKDPDCIVVEDETVCAPPPQNFRIQRVITHPQYNNVTQHNDIALLRLDHEADLSSGYVLPICIPLNNELTQKNYVNENLIVAGWGKIDAITFSNVKMYVEVPVKSNSECRAKYSTTGREIIKSQMCAGGVAGKDSCTGDSGGPLMSIDELNRSYRYHAIGVVSYGPSDCGTESWPGVYTRVGSYAKWILDQIEE